MLVLGHRGASAYAPENTRPAFLKAIEQMADGVELDVHLTRDKKMVVHHNFEISETSNGSGLISEYTLQELKKLDFGAWKGKKFKNTPILTLEECLQIVGGMHLINIELKHGENPYNGLVPMVCDLVKRTGLLGRVILSSFYHEWMKEAKSYMPEIQTGLLYAKPLLFPVAHAQRYHADALHPHFRLVSKGLVKRAQKAGIAINAWTVDDKDKAVLFSSMGVHAVITNTPDVVQRALPFH